METGLVHAHGGLRYVVVLLIVLGAAKALIGWLGKQPYSSLDKQLHLYGMVALHVQVLLGLGLYFLSSKVNFSEVAATRYYTVEHITIMLVSAVLVTRGYTLAKKAFPDRAKHLRVSVFFTAACALIAWAIPSYSWFWNK